jgi:hypothetical protein
MTKQFKTAKKRLDRERRQRERVAQIRSGQALPNSAEDVDRHDSPLRRAAASKHKASQR